MEIISTIIRNYKSRIPLKVVFMMVKHKKITLQMQPFQCVVWHTSQVFVRPRSLHFDVSLVCWMKYKSWNPGNVKMLTDFLRLPPPIHPISGLRDNRDIWRDSQPQPNPPLALHFVSDLPVTQHKYHRSTLWRWIGLINSGSYTSTIWRNYETS